MSHYTCLENTIVVISSMTKTTVYVHKKQHTNQLSSGEIYGTIPKSRDRNTRLLRAEALAGAEEDDPLLSCFALLASSPDLPQIPCCAHAAPPRISILLHRPSFHSHPPFAPSSSRTKLLVTAAQKPTPKSLAQCKHVQGGLARWYKTVALLAHAILP